MLTMPDSLITNRRKATALERTSPKADRALSDLEAKQKGWRCETCSEMS
jgi:hypothetical protein